MHPDVVARLRRQLDFLVARRDHLVVDADTHITDLARLDAAARARLDGSPDYYHGRPLSADQLVAEMDAAGVDVSLAWQNPAATPYTADPGANFEALLAANRYVAESGARFPGRFIPAGWTDPRALGVDGARRMAERCVLELGFVYVKMNPAQNAYPIDDAMVAQVVDHVVALGAIPAVHYGADSPYTPAAGLEALARRHPGHPFVAVHMGGGGAGYVEAEPLYHASRALGLRRPNLHYLLSAKRDTHLESALIAYQLAGPPYSRNLSCASDAPYGLQAWNFGGFRALFRALQDGARHRDPRLRARPGLFDDAAVTNFMGRNFADLTIRGCRHLLAQHAGAPAAADA